MFSHPCQLLFFFFHTFQSVEITVAVEKGRECGVYGWGRQRDGYLDAPPGNVTPHPLALKGHFNPRPTVFFEVTFQATVPFFPVTRGCACPGLR